MSVHQVDIGSHSKWIQVELFEISNWQMANGKWQMAK
jgi:hypothetical protein